MMPGDNQHSKKPLKFPLHIYNGDNLIVPIESKLESWYIYESVKRNGEKCRFEIHSNMPLNDIEPLVVKIHYIQLNVYLINEKEEKELLINSSTDNYKFTTLTDVANRQKIVKINSIIGINKLSYNDRASWDIMMNYMEVYSYFNYYNIVPGSSNQRVLGERLIHDSSIIDAKSKNTTYKARFHKKEVEGLEAQYSWNNTDISNFPFFTMLKYNGEELKYSETLDRKRNIASITITFNNQILYKATYPYEMIEKQVPHSQQPIYKTGLICEIDERHANHAVFKFVEKLLQITLKQNRKFRMEEIEKEWFAFCNGKLNVFNNLVLILNFGNYKHLFSLNLRKALENSATFSDIVFN